MPGLLHTIFFVVIFSWEKKEFLTLKFLKCKKNHLGLYWTNISAQKINLRQSVWGPFINFLRLPQSGHHQTHPLLQEHIHIKHLQKQQQQQSELGIVDVSKGR